MLDSKFFGQKCAVFYAKGLHELQIFGEVFLPQIKGVGSHIGLMGQWQNNRNFALEMKSVLFQFDYRLFWI